MHENTSVEEETLRAIIGSRLTSVEFVLDYWQLRFDGPTLTVVTPPRVEFRGRRLGPGDEGFRDQLCDRIGAKVTSVAILPGESILIKFEDEGVFEVPLRDDDYVTAEAAIFQGGEAGWWVL